MLPGLRKTPCSPVNSNAPNSTKFRMKIEYRDNAEISVEAAIDLYKRSTLSERRPVDRPDIFAGMLKHANLVVSAWHDQLLVGIARSLTDFTYVTYLADLAVDADYQRQGLGKRLMAETKRRLAPECMIVLLAAPKANDYYPGLGFEHNPRAWMLKGDFTHPADENPTSASAES